MTPMTLKRARKLTHVAWETGNVDLAVALQSARGRSDEEFMALAGEVEDWLHGVVAKLEEIFWPLWYGDDLAEPERDVFI